MHLLQHKHNADNNWETPFDFTDENYETVRKHYWQAYSFLQVINATFAGLLTIAGWITGC